MEVVFEESKLREIGAFPGQDVDQEAAPGEIIQFCSPTGKII
jgi:hypothetical protein